MSKFCNTCGAELATDNSEFCMSCGARQGSNSQTNAMPNQGMGYAQQPMYSQPIYTPPMVYTEETSVGGWIGWTLLCSFLPIIGQIIVICTAKNKTLKNWAISQFVMMAIGILIYVVLIAALGVTFSSIVNEMIHLVM